MRFEITFTNGADRDLDHFERHVQRLIVDGIERFLRNDADVESRRRKRPRPNPLAPWELRLGPYRVFYRPRGGAAICILAIGHKTHNALFIRGEKVML